MDGAHHFGARNVEKWCAENAKPLARHGMSRSSRRNIGGRQPGRRRGVFLFRANVPCFCPSAENGTFSVPSASHLSHRRQPAAEAGNGRKGWPCGDLGG
jgi:hypothetical protein